MNKIQVNEILEYLSMSYPSFGDVQSKFKFWNETLQFYGYNDVKARIEELMQSREFSQFSPTLSRIVASLTKTNEKIENSDIVYFCQFCGRSFAKPIELSQHEDRCRSVKYIVKQYARYGLGTVDKRLLYQLPNEEFDKRYLKLLKIIYDKTNDSHEKRVIECIFNPPNRDEAMKVLKQGGTVQDAEQETT